VWGWRKITYPSTGYKAIAAERSGASQQSKLNKVTGPTLTKAAKLPKNVV
jgi:hypothetical protein